jgi:hypothetical protein
MFKALNTKLSFRHIFNAMEEKSDVGVMQSWKQFSLADCSVTVERSTKGTKTELGQCMLDKVVAGSCEKFHENPFF